MKKVVPALRIRISGDFIDKMIEVTIGQMEVAATARKRVLKKVASDTMEAIVDETVRDVTARVEGTNAERLSQVDGSQVRCLHILI